MTPWVGLGLCYKRCCVCWQCGFPDFVFGHAIFTVSIYHVWHLIPWTSDIPRPLQVWTPDHSGLGRWGEGRVWGIKYCSEVSCWNAMVIYSSNFVFRSSTNQSGTTPIFKISMFYHIFKHWLAYMHIFPLINTSSIPVLKTLPHKVFHQTLLRHSSPS